MYIYIYTNLHRYTYLLHILMIMRTCKPPRHIVYIYIIIYMEFMNIHSIMISPVFSRVYLPCSHDFPDLNGRSCHPRRRRRCRSFAWLIGPCDC